MTGRIATIAGLLLCILGPAAFGFVAMAQEPSYSADSLMATFDPSSGIVLKGSTIAFEGPIAEITRTRLIFRTSLNNKVICELRTPLSSGDTRYAVGNQITITGKVRGRGVLGNVTLDQCVAILPAAAPAEEPPPVPEIVEAIAPPVEEIPAALPAQAVPGAVETNVPGTVEPPVTQRLPVPLASQAKDVSMPKAASTPTIEPPPDPVPVQEKPQEASTGNSESPDAYLQGIVHTLTAIALVVMSVVVITKVGPVLTAKFRGARGAYAPNAEETRRAAIEMLLSKEQRKRF